MIRPRPLLTLACAALCLLAVPAGRAARAELVIEAEGAAVRTEGGPGQSGFWNLWSNGRVGESVRFSAAGTYRIEVRAFGSPAGGAWPEMGLAVDGQIVGRTTVDSRQPADYRFSVELPAGACEIAAAFLNDAVAGGEDRNLYLDRITIAPPAGAADPVRVGRAEMAAQAERREQEALDRARQEIEKNRKSDAVVEVVDAAGRPVAGAEVEAVQRTHDFLFGCNIYRFDRFRDEANSAAYKRRFEELFNYATTGFYWRSYEARRGQPQYDYTDKVVAWCEARGIRLKGHPLLWGNPAGIPAWSQGQPAPDVQRQRVLDIMNRYRDRIEFWEVVNEPSHLAEPKIDEPYRWARQANPKAYLIVNDYYVMADGQPRFFAMLKQAIADGVPFDGIGIQAHEPRTMRFPLDQVWRTLDRYATLGKDLHITEFTPASGGQKITGSHREGTWDEAAQADYAVKFYTVCFAHPAVMAITWWDLCDDGSWLPGGGMLRADMTPKPVYEDLKRLIHTQWQTRVKGETGPDGRLALRGFHGSYRIVVSSPGGRAEGQFHLEKGGENVWTVRLPAAKANGVARSPGKAAATAPRRTSP
jgi:endo-1,4-beta-xylanase